MEIRKTIMNIKKIESNDKIGIILAVTLIAFVVISRVLPHPANFAPIGAVALFGGAILPKKLALTLPLAAMIISDLLIGLHPLIIFTWGSFMLIALLSSYRFKTISATNMLGGSIGASIIFYVISNFGVWQEGRLYPATLAGLTNCYYNALPFFRNTLLGDLAYTGVLFGLFVVAHKLVKSRQTSVV